MTILKNTLLLTNNVEGPTTVINHAAPQPIELDHKTFASIILRLKLRNLDDPFPRLINFASDSNGCKKH